MDAQPPDEREPEVDYRFLLANERTFLAYVRTALSAQVAGLGVLQFLTHASEWVRVLLGVTLVAVGSFVGLASYLRFRATEQAIRTGAPMPAVRAALVVAAAVVVLPPVAAVTIALGRG